MNFLLLQTTGERSNSAGYRQIPKEKNRALYTADAIGALVAEKGELAHSPLLSAFFPMLMPIGQSAKQHCA